VLKHNNVGFVRIPPTQTFVIGWATYFLSLPPWLLYGACHRARVRTTRWLAKKSLEKRRHWEEAEQKRTFELSGDELSYRVPARPDGNIPISVWRRLE